MGPAATCHVVTWTVSRATRWPLDKDKGSVSRAEQWQIGRRAHIELGAAAGHAPALKRLPLSAWRQRPADHSGRSGRGI